MTKNCDMSDPHREKWDIKSALVRISHWVQTTGHMNDQRYSGWDIRIKMLTFVGLILGGIWAIESYRLTSEKEFRHPFWDKQLALYFEANDAASRYVALSLSDSMLREASSEQGEANKQQREANKEKFWNLYYGQLAVVEDDETVCNAMVMFGKCLVQPGSDYPADQCDDVELQNRALDLAYATRLSIGNDWDRKLDNLRDEKQTNACRGSMSR